MPPPDKVLAMHASILAGLSHMLCKNAVNMLGMFACLLARWMCICCGLLCTLNVDKLHLLVLHQACHS